MGLFDFTAVLWGEGGLFVYFTWMSAEGQGRRVEEEEEEEENIRNQQYIHPNLFVSGTPHHINAAPP